MLVGPSEELSQDVEDMSALAQDLPPLSTSFEYKPLPEGKIRLLKIAGSGAMPMCTLEDYSLEDAPE